MVFISFFFPLLQWILNARRPAHLLLRSMPTILYRLTSTQDEFAFTLSSSYRVPFVCDFTRTNQNTILRRMIFFFFILADNIIQSLLINECIGKRKFFESSWYIFVEVRIIKSGKTRYICTYFFSPDKNAARKNICVYHICILYNFANRDINVSWVGPQSLRTH